MEGTQPDGDGPDLLDALMARAEQEFAEGGGKDWEKEFNDHPAFMESNDPRLASHLIDAVKALDLEDDDPDEGALKCKKDGNLYFKVKKYHSAIQQYTDGIKSKSPNKELNAILLSNRAASNIHLENYRSGLRDCVFACKLQPTYIKAIIKASQCCIGLKKPVDGILWCDKGLSLESGNKTLLALRQETELLMGTVNRDRRRDESKSRKLDALETALTQAITTRAIHIAEARSCRELTLSHLESGHPSGARVFLGPDQTLTWPVMFVYPEFRQTDFIHAFNENHCFRIHLEMILGPDNDPPPWDLGRRYQPNSVEVYYENREQKKLYKVKKDSTLKSVVANKRFVVHKGTPAFIILVNDSTFGEQFISEYTT